MVTLVQEDGSGLANSNSYVSLAEADEYFSGHPFYADAWALLASGERTLLLVAATRSLDVEYVWRGKRASTTQALEWPRSAVVDQYDTLLASDEIPLRLRQATCEQAYYLTKGDKSAEAIDDPGLDKLKIDVIELDFAKSIRTTRVNAVPTAVRALLRGLGDYAAGSRVRRVVVG